MTAPLLDHIVIHIPYESLSSLPAWLTTNFTITPGGKHTHGPTSNVLICLRSGAYLELIAFDPAAPPAARAAHYWGATVPGVIDFALTTTGPAAAQHERMAARLAKAGAGVSYAAPAKGGRTRGDGVEVSWEVTSPEGVRRGTVPFWCHDVTPRAVRVRGEEEWVVHSCGAVGVREMTVVVPRGRVEEVVRDYEAVLGVQNEAGESGEGVFTLGSVVDVGLGGPVIRVRAPGEGEEWMERAAQEHGRLLGDLVVGAPDGRTVTLGKLEREGDVGTFH